MQLAHDPLELVGTVGGGVLLAEALATWAASVGMRQCVASASTCRSAPLGIVARARGPLRNHSMT